MFTEAPSYFIFWAGWTVWGSNSGGGGERFSAPIQSSLLGPTQLPVQWVPGFSPWG